MWENQSQVVQGWFSLMETFECHYQRTLRHITDAVHVKERSSTISTEGDAEFGEHLHTAIDKDYGRYWLY